MKCTHCNRVVEVLDNHTLKQHTALVSPSSWFGQNLELFRVKGKSTEKSRRRARKVHCVASGARVVEGRNGRLEVCIAPPHAPMNGHHTSRRKSRLTR